MGRTQPSYTSAIDREMEKFERILRRASPNLLPVLERAKGKIRYFQNASYDEELSPIEIVFLSLLSELEEECKND
ncbi:DNA polymerase II [Acidianus brierleyi]|uniref:DNA polymerase II n=1 Tax=Acidianus brierleyi TaxID=41673 RepID=A0A2U9IJ20_9CREN|nr:DNA polymerase II [Acidianus brierleyi]AWR96039.1 DNA polymerase II [Acidianus brierleyi]